MDRDDSLLRSVERLVDLEVEYEMTIRVLAVMTEQMQTAYRAGEIRLELEQIEAPPDLTAWRGENGIVCLRATR